MKSARRPENRRGGSSSPAVQAAAGVSPGRVRTAAIILTVATFLLYIPTLSNGFMFGYDDDQYLTENGVVPKGLTIDGIRWAFTTTFFSNWLPITWLSHMLDVSLFGMNPAGHHAMSALLHGLNATLLMLCLMRVTGRFGPSLAVAVLFAVHPLRVESVSWAAERKDVLAALFFFLTILAYLRYVRRRTIPRFLLVMLCHALGLMSKTMVVTLPAVLLLLDWWPLGRLRIRGLLPAPAAGSPVEAPAGDGDDDVPSRHSVVWLVLEKVPLFLLSAIASAWTMVLQREGGALEFGASFTLGQRLANVVVSIARYLGKIFVPVDLAVLYPHPGHWPALTVAASTALFVVVTVAAFVFRRRAPYLLMGWLWFLIVLLPVSQIVQSGMQSMADRFSYLPSIGITVAIVWLGAEVLRRAVVRARQPGIATAVVGSVAAAYAVVTIVQQRYWENSFTLFSRALATTQDNWIAHSRVGSWYADHNDLPQAERHLRQCIAIRPSFAGAHNNLAVVLGRQGRLEESLAEFRAALQLEPDHPLALNEMGRLLIRHNRAAEALAPLERAVQRYPGSAEPKWTLASAMTALGRHADGVRILREALKQEPDNAAGHYVLGNALRRLDRPLEAIEEYQTSLRLDPKQAEAHLNLGALLAQQGNLPGAAESFGAAVRARPDWVDARVALGQALLTLGRVDEASEQATAAMVRQGGNPRVVHLATKVVDERVRLGEKLLAERRLEGAAEQAYRALQLQPGHPGAVSLAARIRSR